MTFLAGLLKVVPGWAFALALALGYGAWQHHRATAEGAIAVKAEQGLATLRADAAQAAIQALAMQVKQSTEAVNAAKESSDRDRAGAADAAGALRRLRDRAAARSAAAAASAAGGGAPASARPNLCTDLLGRIGDLARRYAAVADQRGTAGSTCERISDAVKP